MPIGLESDAFRLQQRTMLAPSWGCAAFGIHHTMARKLLGAWSIAQCAAYHARMTRPTC